MGKGAQNMFWATFFFSIMQLLVKKLSLPVFEIIFFRALISFVFCSIEIKRKHYAFWGNEKPRLIARGVFGAASLCCFFFALHNAPLGSVVTMVNIKPFLVLVLAMVLLKEKVYWQQWLFFGVSFLGIVLVKGFDKEISNVAFWAILGAAVFAAIAHTIVRSLKGKEKPEVILLYFTLITLPIVGPFTFLQWKLPEGLEWVYLFTIGVVTHLGQLFLTKAYQSDRVANVSNIYFLGIAFALFYGYFFFDEVYSPIVLLGFGLIIGGVILNVYYGKKGISLKKDW